jgi:hypothetical protein
MSEEVDESGAVALLVVAAALEDDGVEEEGDEVDAGAELVGAALVVGLAEEVGGAGAEEDDDAGLPLEPSVLKTTMLAEPPLGTVTTQKLALPTPMAESGLSRPLTPPLDGSMLHGRPLQPPAGHSMRRPKVGVVWASGAPINMGFHAILTKVSPLATVLAPAT